MEKVTLQLKWIHQFQFAGYYAAKEKGYYRDAGLDVTILEAMYGKDPVDNVVSGKAEYGVGTSSLLLMKNAGKPVVVLGVIFQHSPYVLLTKSSSATQSIHDLAGKRFMLEPQADELVAYMKKEGISLKKMKLIEHTFDTNDLVKGNTDVFSGYISSNPFDLEKANFAYQAYSPRSAGIDFYGDNLFTMESELKKHPERVKAFREASMKGWQYALQHTDEIINLIIKEYSPKLDFARLKYEADKIRQLMRPDLVEIGYMHEGRWQHIADTYTELGMLDNKIDYRQFMYDAHPNKNHLISYRIAAALLIIAITLIFLRLINTSRNLKNSEEKFFKAFENAPLMKTISSVEGAFFLDVNAKFTEVTGFEKKDAIGRNSIEMGLLTHEYREKVFSAIDINGRFSDVEIKINAKDGRVIDCIIFGEVMRVGQKMQLLTDFIDVSDKKRSEEQIRKLSQAVEQSPVIIVITDTDGNIEFVNQKFVNITGYAYQEAIGKNPRLLKSGETPVEVYEDLWNTIKSGRVWIGELFNRKKNGEGFWERTAISPIKDSTGVITHFLATKEDITEQKKIREQLLQSQKIEAVGQLTGGLAHDFNNILCVIGGYSYLLQMGMPPDDPQKERLNHIIAAVEKAGNLTHSLLAFSRKQIMKPENANLNQIIFEFGKFITRVIGENINFVTNLSKTPLQAFVDSGQIEQVLLNLATNARDAMPSGGTLSIDSELQTLDDMFVNHHGYGASGDYAVITVTDTGLGMDEKTKQMIFEPFFTTKEVGKGTGLGMSMVFGIVKQHNGFISLYSEKGHGTVFRIYLPIATSTTDEIVTDIESDVLPTGSGTLLLVEDDPTVRLLTEIILQQGGYDIMLAENGKDALEIFAEHHDVIKLVVMDMIMPVMSGKESFREMQKIVPTQKVLFCSGYSIDMIEHREEFGEFCDYVMKPVLPRDMLLKVKEMMN